MTRTMIVLLLLGLVVTGCGSSGDDDDNANTAPVADATFNPTCTTSSMTEIEFTSASTDADGDTLTCEWDFSTGTPSSGDTCTVSGVTFPDVAPDTVTLTVDDGHGGTDTWTGQIGPC